MKFSVNWLREFVELPANVDELLTFAGVEIEGIEQRGLTVDHVVVGQINASAKPVTEGAVSPRWNRRPMQVIKRRAMNSRLR